MSYLGKNKHRQIITTAHTRKVAEKPATRHHKQPEYPNNLHLTIQKETKEQPQINWTQIPTRCLHDVPDTPHLPGYENTWYPCTIVTHLQELISYFIENNDGKMIRHTEQHMRPYTLVCQRHTPTLQEYEGYYGAISDRSNHIQPRRNNHPIISQPPYG